MQRNDNQGAAFGGLMFSWQDMVEMMYRRRILVLAVVAIGSAAFSLLALIQPPLYWAHAKLLVKPNVAQTPVSASDGDAIVQRGTDFRAMEPQVNHAVAMLESPALIRTVLELNAARIPQEPVDKGAVAEFVHFVKDSTVGLPGRIYRNMHGVPADAGLDGAVAAVIKDLRVAPVEKSNVIMISFRHEDRRWASHFVNSLMATYLSPEHRPYELNDSLSFFQGQRERLEGELGTARQNLRDFRETTGNDLAYEDEGHLKTVLGSLQEKHAAVETQLAGVNARIASLSSEIKRLPTHMSEPLRMQLVGARTDRSELTARRKSLEGDIASYADKLGRFDEMTAKRKSLEARLDIAESAFLTYFRKEEQARFAGAAHDANMANFAVAEAAVLPVAPEPSKKGIIILLGMMMSLCASIAFAFVRERMDPSIKTIAEAQALAGVPVLAAIPDEDETPA